jgi:hypothetical protein
MVIKLFSGWFESSLSPLGRLHRGRIDKVVLRTRGVRPGWETARPSQGVRTAIDFFMARNRVLALNTSVVGVVRLGLHCQSVPGGKTEI